MPVTSLLAGLPTVSSAPTASPAVLGGVLGTSTLATSGVGPVSSSLASASVHNVLPWAGALGSLATFEGTYVGEGLPPIPQNIATKITAGRFVEMYEMLPGHWAITRDEKDNPKKTRGTNMVTEFPTWVQCFALYTSVLGGRFPELIPELMAYMATIARVSQDFAGLAWVRYDAAFRRQAATTGNRKWSQINPSLYALCFTGKAVEAPRCDLCLSLKHTTQKCQLQEEADPELPSRLKAVESAVVSLAARFQPTGSSTTFGNRPRSEDLCRLWNRKACRYAKCRYRHACSKCGGGHPAMDCPSPASDKNEKGTDLANRTARRESSRPY